MTHLNDEQLELILQGQAPPPHVAGCEHCQARLAESRAVRSRLQSAFSSIRADADLAAGVRQLADDRPSRPAPAQHPREWTAGRRLVRLFWPAMAAAAVLVIVIPLGVYLTGPKPAAAAELYELHQHALSPETDLYVHADPQELATQLEEKLGFRPAVPRLGAGMSLRGCCVAHFRDKPVGSYVVDTDRGVISVVVLTEKTDVLDLGKEFRHEDRVYRATSFAECNMVAVELDGFTYCAIGEVSNEFLADLLNRLVPSEPR